MKECGGKLHMLKPVDTIYIEPGALSIGIVPVWIALWYKRS
jgi:hypothetical protein